MRKKEGINGGLHGHTGDCAILLLDKTGKITSCNKGAEYVTGYDSSEIIGHPLNIFHIDNDRESSLCVQLLKNAGAREKTQQYEGWRLRKDGTKFWGNMTIAALRDDHSNIIGYSKIIRDLTEQHRLDELERNIAGTLINNTPDLMWCVDRNYRLVSSNSAFDNMIRSMTGVKLKKGSNVLDTGFEKEEVARWKGFYDRALKGETFSEIEHTNVLFEYWSKTTFYPVFEQDEIMGVVCSSHDITIIKEAEKRIVYTNRLYAFLSEMNKAIVRATDKHSLYKEACRIAVECGKFRMAWVSSIDAESRDISLLEHCNMPAEDINRFTNQKFIIDGPQHHILKTGANYICNNVARDFTLPEWAEWGRSRDIHSFIILPIKESGIVTGTFNLYASEINFFTDEEIKLLESATEDISFALAIYEQEKKRKETERKLEHSEKRLKQAQHIAHIGNWERDFSTNVAIWSDEQCRIFGLSPKENLQTFESWMSFIHTDDAERIRLAFREGLDNLESVFLYYRIIRKDGSLRHIYSECHFDINNDGVATGSFGITYDMTERVTSETKLANANRLYAFTSEVSKSMLYLNDEQVFLNEICNIATTIGKFELAWIGFPDAQYKRLEVIAHNNSAPSYQIKLFQDLACDPDGPIAKALRTGGYYAINSPTEGVIPKNVQKYVLESGFESAICIPVKKGGTIQYTLNLFSRQAGFFGSGEILLVGKAANDISFALDIIEKEKQRTLAETKLNHSETRLKQAQAIAHLGSWEIDFRTLKSEWSEEHCRIFGVPADDNVHTFESYLSYIHPDDMIYVREQCTKGKDSLQSFSYYHRIIRRNDGAIRYIYCDNHFDFDEQGRAIGLYGVSHDITEIKEGEQKLLTANRLYSFISHINQTIVHVNDEQDLFDNTCRIAVEIGMFDFAWIGAIDEENKKICLIAEKGAQQADIEIFKNADYDENGFTGRVLRDKTYQVINNFNEKDPQNKWVAYALSRDFKAGIALPIKKMGRVVFTFNLLSHHADFFSSQEIALLEEAAMDLSFALDVFETEKIKKEAVENLKYSERRLKQAQEVAHFGNWELDFATGIASWSEEALRIYGLPLTEHHQSYETWKSSIHPEDLDYVINITKRSQESLSNIAFFHRIIRRDGTIRHIYSQSNFEFDTQGRPKGLYGVAHDVTEMKEVEAALELSKSNLRLIVDLLPQAVFAKDYDGHFVFVNKTFANIYGLTPKQMINKTMPQLIPGKNDPEYLRHQDMAVINSGIVKIIPELNFTDYTGRERVFYTTKLPYMIPGKNIKAVLGIALDITEQKAAEAEKAKITADIIQRNKDLEQFSYIVSHNLRAPIANIIGITNLLQIPGNDKKDELALIAGLSSSVKKLDIVIRDLNYILQVKSQVSEKREWIFLYGLVRDIETSISKMILNEGAKINCNFDAIDRIFTVKSYLYSIFYNLITNSIKYRHPDREPVIEISSRKDGSKTEFTFTDNGLGIDISQKGEHIFGLYKRFHYHTEGKGMGLYMVKTQVETLGGKITVESEVNNGTIFKIIFDTNSQETIVNGE